MLSAPPLEYLGLVVHAADQIGERSAHMRAEQLEPGVPVEDPGQDDPGQGDGGVEHQSQAAHQGASLHGVVRHRIGRVQQDGDAHLLGALEQGPELVFVGKAARQVRVE